MQSDNELQWLRTCMSTYNEKHVVWALSLPFFKDRASILRENHRFEVECLIWILKTVFWHVIIDEVITHRKLPQMQGSRIFPSPRDVYNDENHSLPDGTDDPKFGALAYYVIISHYMSLPVIKNNSRYANFKHLTGQYIYSLNFIPTIFQRDMMNNKREPTISLK